MLADAVHGHLPAALIVVRVAVVGRGDAALSFLTKGAKFLSKGSLETASAAGA